MRANSFTRKASSKEVEAVTKQWLQHAPERSGERRASGARPPKRARLEGVEMSGEAIGWQTPDLPALQPGGPDDQLGRLLNSMENRVE